MEGLRPCWRLDWRLGASRSGRQEISGVVSHLVCGVCYHNARKRIRPCFGLSGPTAIFCEGSSEQRVGTPSSVLFLSPVLCPEQSSPGKNEELLGSGGVGEAYADSQHIFPLSFRKAADTTVKGFLQGCKDNKKRQDNSNPVGS